MLKNDKEALIKRLVYKSKYMGCRENDIIFGTFAANNLHNMADNELLLYQDLLEQNDAQLLAWLTSQAKAPQKFSALIEKILNYKLIHNNEPGI